MLNRRAFIRSSAVAAGTLSFNPAFLRGAFARQAKPGPSPYGELGPPDANGIRLPDGFESRLIGRANFPFTGSPFAMPAFPDGAATYEQEDGGWILAVNSEHPLPGQGGAFAIRFDKNAQIVDTYRILGGTQTNCSGGETPWNTWLSCEEHAQGHTWECDIYGQKPAVELPALGTFSHEAACVDPIGKRVYQTEDEGDSGFYRFTPDSYPDLTSGLLEVAVVDANGLVTWKPVPDPSASTTPTRKQVPDMTQFKRGEGLFFEYPFAFVTTTSDSRIHAYNVVTETMEVLWNGEIEGPSPAFDVDQLTHSQGGEIFVCEDEGLLRISILSADGRVVAPFLQLDGAQHTPSPEFGNETSGVAFDPSGSRMYFSAQRSYGFGALYEITGPFRRRGTDLRHPTLRVEAPERATFQRLHKRGIPVEVIADEPATITATLRMRGKRRRRIARTRLTVERGERKTLTLQTSDMAAERLSRRKKRTAKLIVHAVDEAGNKRTVTRLVALKRRRRRADPARDGSARRRRADAP